VGSALFEEQPLTRQVEFHVGISLNRNVDADLAVFIPKCAIGMFADEGLRRQTEKADRFQWAFEDGERSPKIGATVEEIGIGETARSRGLQVGAGPAGGTQSDTPPDTAVVAAVVVRGPLMRLHIGEVAAQLLEIETKRKPEPRLHKIEWALRKGARPKVVSFGTGRYR